MSVVPLPVTPEPIEAEARPQPPALHLVAGHEHVWQLRAVEYDDAFEVRRYECEGCADVHFR